MRREVLPSILAPMSERAGNALPLLIRWPRGISKMRERGARVGGRRYFAVAADDGIKPQTLEALAAIKTANIPYIIALNKIISRAQIQIQ